MIKVVCVVLLGLAAVNALSEPDYQFLFTKWVQEHQKAYSHDNFFTKFNTFKVNLDLVMAHNAGNHSYTLAMNQFGDLTTDEFRHMLGTRPRSQKERELNIADLSGIAPAASVDWVAQGKVNGIKDQGQCGSCWAFSAVGAIESAWAIKNGDLENLAEQQLVDCAGSQGNQGCNGGLMDYAFKYTNTHALCPTSEYPYIARDEACKASSCKSAKVKTTGYKDVAHHNEAALLTAVNLGPVSIAIEADTSTFQFYHSGIMDDPKCGTNLDHGVIVVGYNTLSGKDYWVVRNSWGTSWGNQGYVWMVRNKNQCGLATEPSYPTV